MGGHVSKVHPGMQSGYTHKMEVYNARTEQRKNLALAKEWFTNTTGLNPKNHRVIITNIKKILMSGEEPVAEIIMRKVKLLD